MQKFTALTVESSAEFSVSAQDCLNTEYDTELNKAAYISMAPNGEGLTWQRLAV